MDTITEPRQIIRAAIRDYLDGLDEIETNAVVDHIIKEHGRKLNSAAFVQEMLRLIIKDELRVVLRGERVVATEHGAIREDALDIRAKEIAARIFESVGGTSRKTIPAMTRPELLFVAEQREAAASGHLRWARLVRDYARRMPDDEVTVGEFFSDREFEQIWEHHFEKATLPGV